MQAMGWFLRKRLLPWVLITVLASVAWVAESWLWALILLMLYAASYPWERRDDQKDDH